MRDIKYTRPNIVALPPWLAKRVIKEIKEMPEPDMEEIRLEAEACKKRILERRKKEAEKRRYEGKEKK